MKTTAWKRPFLALVLSTGCGSSVDDTGSATRDSGHADTDTDTQNTPTTIDIVEVYCPDEATWEANVETSGWASSGLINMWETANTPPWDEEHILLSVDADPGGAWDVLAVRLIDEASVPTFLPNTNTAFSCGIHDLNPVMTYMARVYDLDGALADCWLWQSDPNGVVTIQSGAGSTNNPMSDPDDVAGCTVYTP